MAENQLNRRQFLAGMGGMGAVAAIFAATGGSTGSQGPPGPNQPGTTNRLPRWTNGPGGIFGDSHVSDDGTSVTDILPFILGTTAIKLDDEGTILTDPTHCGTPAIGSFLPDTLRARTTRSLSGTLLELMPNGLAEAVHDVSQSEIRLNLTDVFSDQTNYGYHQWKAVRDVGAYKEFESDFHFGGSIAHIPVHENYEDNKVWSIETDAHFKHWVQTGLSVDYQIASGETEDVNPFMQIFQSGLKFGAGGASAVDAYLKRVSATDYQLGLNNAAFLDFVNAVTSTSTPNIRVNQSTGNLIINGGSSASKYVFVCFDQGGGLVVGAPASNRPQNQGSLYVDRAIGVGTLDSATAGDISLSGTLRFSPALSPSSRIFWKPSSGGTGATILENSSAVELLRVDNSTGNLILDFNLTPNADASKDIGTSAPLRFRDIYASRRAIIAGKNALVLDGQSMTQSSHTISNADTDIATYSLGANSYTRVIVRVTGYVSFVTLSTNQSINLKIKDGSTQVGNTMVVDGALSAAASIPFTLEAAFVETSAVTIHFTEGAAAADANTTVFINSIIVLAES